MSSNLPSVSEFTKIAQERTNDAAKQIKRFSEVMNGRLCDTAVVGEWKQVHLEQPKTDSLCPLLEALGAPGFVCSFVDRITTTIKISCEDDGRRLRVVDRTQFTRENVTETLLDGTEKKCKTKGGRKEYMMSGRVKRDGANQIICRLFERGDGWYTISERSLVEGGKFLRERNILKRPPKVKGERRVPDVVIDRFFERVNK
jgi:hypothetical protein